MIDLKDFGFDFMQPSVLPEEKDDWEDSDDQESADDQIVEEDVESKPTPTPHDMGHVPDDIDITQFPSSIRNIRYKTNVITNEGRRNKRKSKPRKKIGRPCKRYKQIRGVVYKINYKSPLDVLATYEEAKQFCVEHDIKSHVDFRDYAKLKGLPKNIPSAYVRYYKRTGEWKGAADFFSKEKLQRPPLETYLPFQTARALIKKIGTINTWKDYCAFVSKYNENRTYNRLPTKPYIFYPEYHSLSHYLSITKISSAMKRGCVLNFVQAREYVHSLGLGNIVQWKEYTKTHAFPYFLYKNPDRWYVEWKGWKDFLGYSTEVIDYLEKMETVEVVLGIFSDITDPTTFVYQIFSGGEYAVHAFEVSTKMKCIRMYEFDVKDKLKWVKLVTEHSDYHECNMFTTNNIHSLLFTSDAILPIKKGTR